MSTPFKKRGIATAAFFVAVSAWAQVGKPESNPPSVQASYRYQGNRLPKRAGMYYSSFWGIDSLSAKVIESGELIRFTWRVVDPEKAKPLHDKKYDPFLIDPAAHVKLVVPSLEKVGQLRQSSTPIEGKTYWMAFSNKGGVVKRGDMVTVVIGLFHAENLIVQ